MKSKAPIVQICPGISRRTLVHGETMYQMIATLEEGSRLPEHHHPQEQILHVLEGRLRVTVAGETHEFASGESYYLASEVPHSVETIVATRVLDTFSPPRRDYLAIDEQTG